MQPDVIYSEPKIVFKFSFHDLIRDLIFLSNVYCFYLVQKIYNDKKKERGVVKSLNYKSYHS